MAATLLPSEQCEVQTEKIKEISRLRSAEIPVPQRIIGDAFFETTVFCYSSHLSGTD